MRATVRTAFACRSPSGRSSSSDGLYPDPFDPAQGPPQVMPIVEEFDNLVWDDPGSVDFYLTRLHGNSSLVTVSPTSDQLNERPAAPFAALAGGTDGSPPSVDDYRGQHPDPLLRTGLAALEAATYGDVALVVAPGANGDIVTAVIEHCEEIRYRFAIVDTPAGQANAASIDPRATWDTSYAAFYYPWLYVADPETAMSRLVPPSGHVAGSMRARIPNAGCGKLRQRDSDRSHRPRICGE